ncbi:MAG: isoprenylcysteine carboxylmethyltransferase family protein [bacterium]
MKWQPFGTKSRQILGRVFCYAMVVYVLLVPPPASVPLLVREAGQLIGLVLLTIAAGGRIWCLQFIGGRKNTTLLMDGPYSVVRNPLYVFSFIGAVGFGLTVQNPYLALLLAVTFALYYSSVVLMEERTLAATFKAEFDTYASKIPRWIPRFSVYSEPESVTVLPRQFRKSMLDAMWFIWVYLFWEIIQLARTSGLWPYGLK